MSDKDWKLTMSPEAMAQLKADPELAAAFRVTSERLQTVLGEVNAGRIPDIETALSGIGCERIEPDDEPCDAERLAECIFHTVDEFATAERMTTGDVMSALFSVLVAAAKGSPHYDRERTLAELRAAIELAFGETSEAVRN